MNSGAPDITVLISGYIVQKDEKSVPRTGEQHGKPIAALPLVIPLLLNITKGLLLRLEERTLLLQEHTEDQMDVVQADHTKLKLIQPFKEQSGHSVVKNK